MISNVCYNYFNLTDELKNFRNNDTKINCLALVKVISIFTGVIPLAFAVVYGIDCLLERRYEKAFISRLDEKVRKIFNQIAADAGNAAAQYYLAGCYSRGDGVQPNWLEAFNWYEKAAKRNHPDAQFQLGFCYRFGRGVSRDEQKAFNCFKKLAEKGHPLALEELGALYGLGVGVTKNIDEEIRFFTLAHEKGNSNTARYLANFYANHPNLDKEGKLYVSWLVKSAEIGNSSSQYELGNLYITGQKVERNLQEAFKWIEKAAEHDYEAKNQLGELYEKGIGIEQSHENAMICYKAAAVLGSKKAQNNLERLRKNWWNPFI